MRVMGHQCFLSKLSVLVMVRGRFGAVRRRRKTGLDEEKSQAIAFWVGLVTWQQLATNDKVRSALALECGEADCSVLDWEYGADGWGVEVSCRCNSHHPSQGGFCVIHDDPRALQSPPFPRQTYVQSQKVVLDYGKNLFSPFSFCGVYQ